MIRQTIAHSWRSIRRAPVFAIAVVLTLTIGIGSASAIFAVVNAVLLRPLPYGHPDELVGVWFDMPSLSLLHAQQMASSYFAFKRFTHSIDGIAVYQTGSVNVGDPDGRSDPQRLERGASTANLVSVLQIKPALGRGFTEEEDQPKGAAVAMISDGLWKTRFAGSHDVIGKRLLLNGVSTEIVGVLPATFRFGGDNISVWTPLRLDANNPFPGGFNYTAVARLKNGMTIDAAQRDFASVVPRIVEVSPTMAPGVTMQMVLDQAKPTPRLVPLRDDVIGDVSRTLWMVAATAVLLLFVTCANVANLLLVRADGRHRELSVRAALGAGQGKILGYFFAESGLLVAFATVLGIAAAFVATRLLVAAGPAQIPRLAEVHVDGAVVAFTITVSILVSVACASIPAIRFMRSDPLAGLRDGGRSGTAGSRRQRARSALVTAQMAFAIIVLSVSGLLLRSYAKLAAVRPGFNAAGTATMWLSLPAQRYPKDADLTQFYAELARRAATLPGIKAVGLTSHLPLIDMGTDNDPFYAEGDESYATKIPPLEIYSTVDSGYIGAMGIPLIAGRNFDAMERQHGDEAMISQETARQFFRDSTGRSAIGKRFRELPNGQWHTIIGVVGSVHDTSLAGPPTRSVYLPEVRGDTALSQVVRTMAVVVRTSDAGAATRALRQLVREMDPSLPTFGVRSMQEAMDASMARLTFTMLILGVAAAVTLVLGVVGLYGVIAYIVTLRTRELGVRIALGAQPGSVAVMVTRQGLAVSGVGVAIGLAVVLVVARFIRSLLFDVAPTDPVTLGSSAALLLAFALIATWIPARRAARINPTEALRAD